MYRFVQFLWVLAVIGGAAPLRAQVGQDVVLRGFGTWAYGRTSDNIFLGKRPEGDFRSLMFSLNAGVAISDRIAVRSQMGWRESDEGSDPHLDYAFAEYKLKGETRLRFGKIKQSFGIYSEVLTVGTIRPFLDLPQGVYDVAGFVAEGYKGAGITGRAGTGNWSLTYDVYGGGMDLETFSVPGKFYRGDSPTSEGQNADIVSTRNLVGGRVVVNSPIRGLSFGGSAYSGTLNEPAANRRTAVGGQVEYRSNAFSAQSEVVYQNQVGDERATGAYVQAAYRLSPEWQVAGQYNNLKTVFANIDPSAAPSLQYHREGAFALNYWFSRSLVLKAEYHRVNGNRFSVPDHDSETLRTAVAAGQLKRVTNLVQFGAQFSF